MPTHTWVAFRPHGAGAPRSRRHAGRAERSDTLLSTVKSIQRGDFPTRRAAAARAAPSIPRLMSAARVGPVVYGTTACCAARKMAGRVAREAADPSCWRRCGANSSHTSRRGCSCMVGRPKRCVRRFAADYSTPGSRTAARTEGGCIALYDVWRVWLYGCIGCMCCIRCIS